MNELTTDQFVFVKVDHHRWIWFSLEISLTPIFINKCLIKNKLLQWVDVIAALEITADHWSMIGENLAVIGRKSPLVIMMIGRNFFPSNLRASYFFPASFFVSLQCLFRITLLHEAAIFNIL